MDNCGICLKSATQLFETGKDGIYACFKCQPLVPEVSIDDSAEAEATGSNPDSESEQAILYCGICHKSFQKSSQLQNHLRNHRAERRFVCTYCNKAFSQSNNLRAHLRIHTNERPYICGECGKAFTQVTNLNNHVRLHTGERPFVCTEPGCGKAYAQVTNLNQHRKRHISGRALESNYECALCGERFDQRNHLYSHRREVHGEIKSVVRSAQKQTCKLCSAQFNSEKQLQAHVATHIPGGDKEDEEQKSSYRCVFSSCGAVVSSPRAHTEHLLAAHQLRLTAPPAAPAAPRPARGRPPKISKQIEIEIEEKDPLEITEYDVKIIKEDPYKPTFKVKSLFQ